MGDARLPLIWFSTAAAPAADRFELYRSVMSATWEISTQGGRPDDFSATMRLADMGPILAGRTMAGPQLMERSLRRARADGQDHYAAVLLRAGRASGMAGESDLTFEAGELRLFDMARSLTLAITAMSSLALLVHRDELDAITPPNAAKHGLKLQGGAATLFREHLMAVAEGALRLSVAEAPILSRATTHLLAACLAQPREAAEVARMPLHAALLRQARRFVDSQIERPDLSAEGICTALGVSRSGLYRLLEPYGGVAAFVQHRRLTRVHMRLLDTQERRKISALALAHGFTNETHFSRCFRRHFGYTPSEVRGGTIAAVSGEASSNQFGMAYKGWLMRA